MNYEKYFLSCVHGMANKTSGNSSEIPEIQRISNLENDILVTEKEGQTLTDTVLLHDLIKFLESRFDMYEGYSELKNKFSKIGNEHKNRLIRHMWSMRYEKDTTFNLYLVERDKPAATTEYSKPIKTVTTDRNEIDYLYRKMQRCIDWAETNGIELVDDEVFDRLNRNLRSHIAQNWLSGSENNFETMNLVRIKYNSVSKFQRSRSLARMADESYSKKLSKMIRNDHADESVSLIHINQMILIEKQISRVRKSQMIDESVFLKTQSKLSKILSMSIEYPETVLKSDSNEVKNESYMVCESAKRIIKSYTRASESHKRQILYYILTNRLMIYSKIPVSSVEKSGNSYELERMCVIKKCIRDTKNSFGTQYKDFTSEELQNFEELQNKLESQFKDAINCKDHHTVKSAILSSGRFIRAGKDHKLRILDRIFNNKE